MAEDCRVQCREMKESTAMDNKWLMMKFVTSTLLLVSVDLKRRQRNKKKNIYYNFTVNDYLRIDPHTGDDGKQVKQENGKYTKLLDLNGYMREKFIYAVSTDSKVSVVCSPFSALMPLGILLFGTSNKATEKELLKAIGLDKKTGANDYFKDLRRKTKHIPEVTTQYTSRIYISDQNKLSSTFKKEAESVFRSCVESIDMQDKAHVAKEVNKWVRYHTNDTIKEILKPSDVGSDTKVMVVDALYFSGLWKYKFDVTFPTTFYGAIGNKKVNLMMADIESYMYGTSNDLGAEAILIPYQGGNASMLVLLPHSKNGLSLLLSQLKLAPELINRIRMKKTPVQLYLPKFKIETSMDLKALYGKVGLKEIFEEGSGLDHMVEDVTVTIDKGIQKAIIEVSESGTVAAAASILHGIATSSMVVVPKYIKFRADHPFLFFIVAHNQQLFAGTFVG